MMTLDELHTMMEKDAKIDGVELGNESLNIPSLHSKYLKFLLDFKSEYRKTDRAFQLLKKLKWEYYTGKMSKEQLEQYKWEPCQLRILKSDIDMYINTDTDVQKAQRYLDDLDLRIEMLESYLKTVLNRHWMIKTAVDWQKFTHGVV